MRGACGTCDLAGLDQHLNQHLAPSGFASVLVKLSLRDPTTDVSIFVIVWEIVGNVLTEVGSRRCQIADIPRGGGGGNQHRLDGAITTIKRVRCVL